MNDEGVNAVWVLTSWTGRSAIAAGKTIFSEGLMLFIISKTVYGQSNAEIDDGKQILIISDI